MRAHIMEWCTPNVSSAFLELSVIYVNTMKTLLTLIVKYIIYTYLIEMVQRSKHRKPNKENSSFLKHAISITYH